MRIRVNTMPLYGHSEGVRRYVRELLGGLELERAAVSTAPHGAAAGRLLTIPKAGFALRHAYELFGAPGPRVDLMHYTDTYGPARPTRVPVVVTVHDTTFLTHPHLHDRGVVHWLSELTRRTWPGVAHFVSVTETTKADLVAAGVAADRITVVPHGCDHITRIRAAPELAGGVDRGRYFYFMGNLEPRKNLRTLLAAFERALPELPTDVSLVIAGKFAWGGQPLVQLRRLQERGRVLHLGFVPDPEAVRLLSDALAFVYPSTYEGFGLPPLEAFALGTPVIAGDNPASREILGPQARYVIPGDVDDLADALLAQLGSDRQPAECIAHAARYTWARTARETMHVYESVLGVL